jgi:hypothetical protein
MGLKLNELEQFYLALAAKDRVAAGLEPLDNVRRKHLTSAATWEGLATLAGKTKPAAAALVASFA